MAHTHIHGDDMLAVKIRQFLSWLAASHFSAETVKTRKSQLCIFRNWCIEREIRSPVEVTRKTLEQYRRYLYHRRKRNGKPLRTVTQGHFLIAVRVFFTWLAKNDMLLYNPSSELALPRNEKLLPRSILTAEEVHRTMEQPDLETGQGIRDRAILETFYSTGIRRLELVLLAVNDLDMDKGILFVRHGKGRKDRVIPIGSRAVHWISIYLYQVRPDFIRNSDEQCLFLTHRGRPFHPDFLTCLVRTYIEQAGIENKGACHAFRHSMATAMLDNGADIRHIQTMLGHSSLDATQIYTKVSILKLKEVHIRTHPSRLKRDSL